MAAARSLCAHQHGNRTGTGNQQGRKHGGIRRKAPSTPGWLTVYLIDTNVLSEVIRPRPNLKVVRQLLATDPALRFASDVTRYELRYGAMLRDDGGTLWARIAQHILPWCAGCRWTRRWCWPPLTWAPHCAAPAKP